MNDTLYGYIISLPLVDSWERLPHCCSLRPRRDIVAELLSDAPAGAMTAAGLDVETLALARSDELSVREKWALIEPYWSLCAHTSACRAAKLAARELYGLDAINACTIEAYDAAFQSTFDADRYKYILKERCHIEFAVLFGDNGNDNLTHAFDTADSGTSESSSGRHTCPHAAGTEPDPRYFRPAGDIGRLVSPHSPFSMELYGTDGTLFIGGPENHIKILSNKIKTDVTGWITPNRLPEALPSAVRQWVDGILKDTPIHFGLEEGIQLTELMEAAYISHREGRQVEFT